jgi:hypothetical protein
MLEKKTKQEPEKKLVEIPPDLLENVALIASPAELKLSENTLNTEYSAPPESESTLVSSVPSPRAVLETKFWLAARFTGITLILGFIPYFLAPGFLLPSFNSPLIRTVALGLLIWNLIGAALFANTSTRSAKIILFLVFALPLMTYGVSWFWIVAAVNTLTGLGVQVSL